MNNKLIIVRPSGLLYAIYVKKNIINMKLYYLEK